LWARYRRDAQIKTALCLALVGAGAVRQQIQGAPGPRDPSRYAAGGYVTVAGTIEGEPEQVGDRDSTLVEVRSVRTADGVTHPCRGRIYLRCAMGGSATLPSYGDALSLTGALSGLPGPRNPDADAFARYLRRQGAFSVLEVRSRSAWRHLPSSYGIRGIVVRRARSLRVSMTRAFSAHMAAERAALLTALVLGGHSTLGQQTQDAFFRSGLLHIVAASGANVAIVVGIVYFLARRLHLSASARALLCVAAVIAYAIAAGAQPPVVRAAVMAIVFVAAPMLDRDRDAASALAFAALGALAYDPGNLADVGFLLSFTIVAFTIAFWPAWQRLEQRAIPVLRNEETARSLSARVARGVSATIGLSVIAGLAAAPVTIQTFRSVSIVSVVSNALVAPAVAASMPAAIVSYLACLVCPPVGALACKWLVSPLASYILGVGNAFASIPGASVSVPAPGWPAVFAAYLALGFAAHRITRACRGQ